MIGKKVREEEELEECFETMTEREVTLNLKGEPPASMEMMRILARLAEVDSRSV